MDSLGLFVDAFCLDDPLGVPHVGTVMKDEISRRKQRAEELAYNAKVFRAQARELQEAARHMEAEAAMHQAEAVYMEQFHEAVAARPPKGMALV